MNICLGCEKPARKVWCSKSCYTRMYRALHRDEINARARHNLIADPEGERAKRAAQARAWRASHPEGSRKFARKKNGIGMIPNENNVIFYGYKPPFRKFKGGFGYEGVLMYSKTDKKVQCHLCGGLFRMLNNGHLGKVHGITARQYKEKVGLSQQTALCGEETREKLLKRGHNPNHMEELKKANEMRRKRREEGFPDRQSGFKLSLEKKNARGTCPDQLLDRIRDAIKKNGGKVPTMEQFVKMNEGKYYGSIRNTFGTWTEAVTKLGLQTNAKRYTTEELIAAMQNFYKVHKRTPKWSDMERGLLPGSTTYYHHFKNINHARLMSKVPLILHLGGNRREEWMPSEQERMMMLSKI